MILPQTILNVADNSGAKKVMCIRVLGTGSKQVAKIGNIIIAVVKKATPNMLIKKSDKVLAVVVRTTKSLRRSNGSYIKFNENAVVLINKDNSPKATRIFGPIAKELREKNFTKIVSLSKEII